MKWQQKSYTFPMPIRYVLSEPGPSVTQQNLVVLLHGYQDNAQSLLKRLGWVEENLPFQFLAINGPFPVPVWNAKGFKEAYSWYFRDTAKGLVIVTPQTTAQFVAQLLTDLGLDKHKKVIFGFSQGGYLAPYIAKLSANVKGLIGLGCGYTVEGYESLNPLPVYALHGVKDEIVPIAQSRQEFESILARGFRGEFTELPELTHKVEPELSPLILNRIDTCFKG